MPIRFSTEAANADHMGPDAEPGEPSEGMAPDLGADGTPRDRASRTNPRQRRGSAARGEPDKSGAGQPGKDINAPGFLKDKDPGGAKP